ncbi:MAG: carbohydrate ABC transporter permease [Clostridia bacterium]|nr:carbohydrate ABC transporter permease [Clostridia bacterium]
MQLSSRQTHALIKTGRSLIWSMIRFVLLTGLVFIILSPLIYYFSNAFKSYADMYDVTVTYIPRSPTIANFRMLIRYIDYPITVLKTFGFTVLVAVLQTLSCLLVGYGLARFNFKGNGLIFALVMITLVIPPQIMLVPIYIRFRSFNLLEIFKFSGILNGISLINTPWPILLLAITSLAFKSGLYVFLFRQFFRNVPVVLEEAAAIDGCNTYGTFFRIMLPNAVTMTVTVFLFSFVLQWNDYYYTRMLMPEFSTLNMKISDTAYYFGTVVKQTEMLERVFYPSYLLLILPLIVLYVFAQRFFVESVATSGIVG